MKYKSNTLIRYQETSGYKRNLYALIIKQLNESCLLVLNEAEPTRPYQVYLDEKTDPNYIKILESVESIKKIPQDTPKQEYFKKVVKFYQKLDGRKWASFLDILSDSRIRYD